VATGSGSTGGSNTNITTSSFTRVSGDTYLVTAQVWATQGGSAPTVTFTASTGETVSTVGSNNFGGTTSPNCQQYCTLAAGYFTASGSTSATVSVASSEHNSEVTIQVLQISGDNPTTPFVIAATNAGESGTSGSTATANLSTTATAGDVSLEIVGSDQALGSSLTWSPSTGVTEEGSGSSSSTLGTLDVYATNPAVTNESATIPNNDDWATLALEINS
jgi:hypothetical protein